MDRQELLQLINNSGEVSNSHLEDLKDLAFEYPYFQAVKALIAKIEPSPSNIKAASLVSSDRTVLKKFVNHEFNTKVEIPQKPIVIVADAVNAFDKLKQENKVVEESLSSYSSDIEDTTSVIETSDKEEIIEEKITEEFTQTVEPSGYETSSNDNLQNNDEANESAISSEYYIDTDEFTDTSLDDDRHILSPELQEVEEQSQFITNVLENTTDESLKVCEIKPEGVESFHDDYDEKEEVSLDKFIQQVNTKAENHETVQSEEVEEVIPVQAQPEIVQMHEDYYVQEDEDETLEKFAQSIGTKKSHDSEENHSPAQTTNSQIEEAENKVVADIPTPTNALEEKEIILDELISKENIEQNEQDSFFNDIFAAFEEFDRKKQMQQKESLREPEIEQMVVSPTAAYSPTVSDETNFFDSINHSSDLFEQKIERQKQIIEKFIELSPSVKPLVKTANESDNESDIDLAEDVLSDLEPIVSENYADILAKQGKKSRAIDIYRQLILKNPQKRDYFAGKIEKLNNS